MCSVLLVLGLIAGNAQAAYISGVTATSNLTTTFGNIAFLTDGTGLSALSFAATHAIGNNTNSWTVTPANPLAANLTVDFNLNGTYSLSRLGIWNFNGTNINRSVKDVAILTSLDGINFSAFSGSPTQFAKGLNQISSAEIFSFTPVTAAYVRFNIQNNWGPGAANIGLSEVAFDGVPASVPAPSALVLFGIGALATFARRRAV